MKKLALILGSFFIYLTPALSQRNIIDIPLPEIVEKGHLFFQEQISAGNRDIKFSTIFTMGLGQGFQAGLSLRDVTINTRPHSRLIIIDPDEPDVDPDLLLNAQKGFKISERIDLGIGTKSGIDAARRTEDIRFVNFSYLNSSFKIPDTEHQFTTGAYYTNYAFAGEGNNLGWMLGAEAALIKDKLSVIGDYLSGNNTLSMINMGIQISLPKEWQIAFAAAFPSPGSDNHHAAVIQLSRK